jgi:hypothetical protein
MLPFYKIQIDEDDEVEGIDFMALVDVPAHLKAFDYFGKEDKKMTFNEEKRIVTGVAIATDQPIYRRGEDVGEHYVIFDEKETFKLAKKMFKNGFFNNVNQDHDSGKVVKAITLIESYFLDGRKEIPEAFKNQKLKKGSWIISYYVEDDEVWDKIKKGHFNGFSVEGYFDKRPLRFNKNKKNKMSNLLDKIKKVFEEESSKFAEATTVDGVSVKWEGELTEGTEIMVVTEEGEVIAPDGDHAIEMEDGVKVITTVNGVVESIKEAEENSVEEALMSALAKINEKFKAQEKEIETLKKSFDSFANATDDKKRKFNKTTNSTGKSVGGWKTLLK